jgi:hypothetical protein
MHNYIYINVDCSVNKIAGLCPGLAFLSGAGGQECQSFPNFGLQLQLDFRRCSRGLQKFPLLVLGSVRSLRRREWLSLYDMQRCGSMDAYTFISLHDKVAIQRNYITY